MQDLINESKTNMRMLDMAINELKTRGSCFAKSEHDYKIALAKFITEGRANGVPVTILNDLARGEPSIAKLRMERDISQSLYESNKEAINAYKLKIRVLNDQIEREWSRA